MKKVKLGEICDLKNGYAFKSNDYIDESETAICRMSNIRPNGNFDIEYNKKCVPNNFNEKYKEYLLKDGDLIVAMTDMAGDPKILGVPTIVETKGYNVLLNQRVGKLIIKNEKIINREYLMFALNNPVVKSYFKRFAGGGVQINIGKKEILGVELFIPSLEIQNKAVKVLRKIQSIIEKRQYQITALDELTQSLFLEMFGDDKVKDKNYTKMRLQEIAHVGSSKRVFVDELVNEGIPFFRGTEIGELAEGKDISPELFITREHYEKLKESSGIPKIGDLLMPSICPDGRVWMVDNDSPFYFKDGRVLWVSFKEDANNPLYIQFALKVKLIKDYLKIASGTTFAELKIFTLKNVELVIPSVELQNDFAEKLLVIRQQKENMKNSLVELESLYNALLQKAFKGELFQD